MDKVKIEKDIFVRDEYGVRVRMFVAGQEIDRFKYDEAFRLNVPVNPEDLPVVPEFRGTESLNGRILDENKELFVEAEKEEVPVKAEKDEPKKDDESKGEEAVVEDEAEVESEAEEVAEEAPKSKKGKVNK